MERSGLLHRHGVRSVLREMKAEAKGLDAVIGLAGGTGKRIVNAVPLPTVLSTRMRPRC